MFTGAETNVFTSRFQRDYNSKRLPHNAYSLWKYDLHFIREVML